MTRTMGPALVATFVVALAGVGATDAEAQAFESPQAANLPTAETLAEGWWLIEISHRFAPPVADGADALWGFDGPVVNRLGLAYSVSDRVTVGVLRTNRHDNLELNAKARFWESESGNNLFSAAAMGGLAWNTEAPFEADDNESQAYGQLILNARFGEKVALGLVPTLLHNPTIEDSTKETEFVMGGNGQIYLTRSVSLLGEWIKSKRRDAAPFDSGTFGIELQTRGHFFKILLTNQTWANPTQIYGGAVNDFEPGEWRVAFNILRRINF